MDLKQLILDHLKSHRQGILDSLIKKKLPIKEFENIDYYWSLDVLSDELRISRDEIKKAVLELLYEEHLQPAHPELVFCFSLARNSNSR